MNTIQKNAHELRAGDIVRMYGGRFQVTSNPRESNGHRPDGYWPAEGVGPSDCVISEAVCIEGAVDGYFSAGSAWPMQGNTRALFAVEA